MEFIEGVAASCWLVVCLWKVKWKQKEGKCWGGEGVRGEVEMNPLQLSMLVGGGVGETGWGDACWWVGEARSPLRQAGQFQRMVEPAAQILRKLARVREKQEKCTHLEQVEHFSESFPTSWEHKEQGNVGGPEGNAVYKSQVVVGGPEGNAVYKSQVVVGGTLGEGTQAL